MGDTLDKMKRLTLGIFQKDAGRFVKTAIGVDPTHQQAKTLSEISKPGAHVSIRSGHGTGKTTSLAWVILWFLSCFPNAKIPCTAPTGHQLFDLLWPEVHKWQARIHPYYRDAIKITSDRIMIIGMEHQQFAVARTARPENPEALQGFHADNLMFLIDEASGVAEKVFEVAEGALSTTGARVLMAANPTRTEGYFYRSHHQDRALWTTLHYNCLDSPLVDPAYPEQMAKKYGKESNIYKVRVLGEFPPASDDVLIPLYLIEAAVDRDVSFSASPRIAGLDVARFGDDANVLLIRQGGDIQSIDQWRNKDLMQTTGIAAEAYRQGRYDKIMVDSIGLGSGVVDRLRELHVPAFAVNVAESSPHKDRFERLRDQLWFSCRDFFSEKNSRINPKIELIDDLIGELATVTYKYTSSGKIKVESKDEMKKRGLSSPNIADALCLTFAEGVSPAVQFQSVRARQIVRQSSDGWT